MFPSVYLPMHRSHADLMKATKQVLGNVHWLLESSSPDICRHGLGTSRAFLAKIINP